MLVSGLEDLSIFKMASGDDEHCPDLHRRLCECVEEMLLKYEQKQKPGKKLTIKTRAAEKLLRALCEAPKGQRETRGAISSALKHHAQALHGHEHLLSEKGNTYALIEQTKGLRETHDNKSTSLLRYHELRNKFLGSDTPLDDEEKKVMSELDKKKDLTLKMLEAIDRDLPFIERKREFKPEKPFAAMMAMSKMEAVQLETDLCDKAFESPGISGTLRVPANMSAIIRTGIISAMKKAGYHPDEGGMCYGIAWTSLSACVRQDGQSYMERMQYLSQMRIPPLHRADVHQLYAFFDAVTLAQTNYEDMIGYSKGIGYPGRQEVAFPGKVIASCKQGYEVAPVVKHTFIAECTPETFIRFLQHTRENNKGIPFGVMIIYLDHAISIGFDGKKWLAADNDCHYYIEKTDLLHVFLNKRIDNCTNRKMIAAIELVVGNEDSLHINADVLVVNAKETMFPIKVLGIGLWWGYANVIADCITNIAQSRYEPETLLELIACEDSEARPGLYMALGHGHAHTITAFIRASFAAIATYSLSEERKAKLLCELLISKRADGTPGFYMAVKNGHADAITAFIRTIAAEMAIFSDSEEEKTELLYSFFHRMENERKLTFSLLLEDAALAVQKAFNGGIDQLPLSAEQKETLKYSPPDSVEEMDILQTQQ